MMARPKKLNAAFVRTIAVPGRYGDGYGGHGLSLLAKPRAHGGVAKSWSQRIRVNGKVTNLGIGSYPVITLAEARTKALENRRAIAQGRDLRGSGTPTFEQAALKVIELHAKNWRSSKSAAQWRSSLETYAFPRLGRKLVSDISVGDIMAVLTANDFWNRRRETASRVRQRISKVMQWAVASGFCDHDPCVSLKAALPQAGRKVKHHAALPHSEVAATIKKVQDSHAWPLTKLCFQLLVLSACRSSEVRKAMSDEVDFEAKLWVVPKSRMKAGKSHTVPLSAQAVQVLNKAQELSDGSGLVFPSPRGRVLSDATLSNLMRELKVNAVPHGFRSSFRDWAAECSDASRETCEAALAHTVRNQTEATYFRTSMLEQRAKLMQEWADYIANSVTHG